MLGPLIWLGMLLGGCADFRLWPADQDDDYLGLPPLTPEHTFVGPEGGLPDPPDGSLLCERDEDCDDGVDCTVDICLLAGYCVSRTDFARCSDGLFCNGTEICDAEEGCLPGPPRTCDDKDVCTIDACDEVGKRCRHEPRDFDLDGEVDWHCVGGTDCDDLDATRGTEVAEICADGIDNDCDDAVDEGVCGRPDHDTCDDALQVDGPGSYVIDMLGIVRDYSVECDKGLSRDAVLTFELDEPMDVDLTVRGLLIDGSEEVATVALRSDCEAFDADRECQVGFPAYVRTRALPKGRYFAIVDSPRATRVVANVDFRPATEAPSNTTCETALDVSEGGRFASNFVDLPDNFSAPCGASGQESGPHLHQADLVYSFTIDETRDVLLSVVSMTDEAVTFSVRKACEDPESIFRCAQDAPALARLHQLPAGTYYVIAETPSYHEVDFELDVHFEAPTPPPPGDSCSDPVDLPLGELVSGELVAKQDEVDFSCQLFSPDTVYRVSVDEPTDLDVTVNGGAAMMRVAVQRTCGDDKSELTCGQGRPSRMRLRDVGVGDYFLVLESRETQQYEVQVDRLPRTKPVPVDGNGLCATAVEIPSEGGLFRGSTTDTQNDYVACGNSRSNDAAFRLVLEETRTVTAAVEAAFDTVLYRYTGDSEVCGTQASACNDDAVGSNSRLQSERLAPGTYYYIVDGFSDSNTGEYVLDIIVD